MNVSGVGSSPTVSPWNGVPPAQSQMPNVQLPGVQPTGCAVVSGAPDQGAISAQPGAPQRPNAPEPSALQPAGCNVRLAGQTGQRATPQVTLPIGSPPGTIPGVVLTAQAPPPGPGNSQAADDSGTTPPAGPSNPPGLLDKMRNKLRGIFGGSGGEQPPTEENPPASSGQPPEYQQGSAWPRISRDATVDPTATIIGNTEIEKDVKVSPGVTIGKTVVTEGDPRLFHPERTLPRWKEGQTYIGRGADIGEESEVGRGAHIDELSRIGKRVKISDEANISGFFKPTTVGDDVEIGPWSGIYSDIGARTKIGEGVRIAPGGKVGDDVKIGRGTHLDCDVTVENKVTIGGASEVGEGATIRKGANVGFGSHIGNEAIIDEGVVLPPGSEIPDGAHITVSP